MVYDKINYTEVLRSSDISDTSAQSLIKGNKSIGSYGMGQRDSTMLSGNDMSNDQPSFGRFTTFKQ